MMLFRRRPEPGPEEPLVNLKVGPTKDEIEAITDFIQLRLAPITPPLFPTPDDTGRAVRALGDAAAAARVMGDSLINQGTSALLQWLILRSIADQWRDHPDYQHMCVPDGEG